MPRLLSRRSKTLRTLNLSRVVMPAAGVCLLLRKLGPQLTKLFMYGHGFLLFHWRMVLCLSLRDWLPRMCS